MQLRHRRRPAAGAWWLIPAAVLVAVLATAPASAGPTARSAGPAAGLPAAAQVDEQIPPEQGPRNCNGGAQEASLVRMNDTPTTIGESAAFQPLQFSQVPVGVPAGDNDQFVLRFTGEIVLAGQPVPVVVPADHVQLQLVVAPAGGAPVVVPPGNDPTFTTGVGESNALQGCVRLPAGNYVFGVRWRVVDVAAGNVLTATMDDWLLSIEQND